MISQKDLNTFMGKVIDQLGLDNSKSGSGSGNDNKKKKNQKKLLDLTPAQIVVVSGILTNVLSVQTFSVDRDQQIQIILDGSLKRKTELEKTLDEIGKKPFDEVLKALVGRL